MAIRLFTFVCEFRGTTHVSQVSASDEREAVPIWTDVLRAERPFGRASAHLAKTVEAGTADFPPVEIQGVSSVWCITAHCGGDFMLADIIETVDSAPGT